MPYEHAAHDPDLLLHTRCTRAVNLASRHAGTTLAGGCSYLAAVAGHTSKLPHHSAAGHALMEYCQLYFSQINIPSRCSPRAAGQLGLQVHKASQLGYSKFLLYNLNDQLSRSLTNAKYVLNTDQASLSILNGAGASIQRYRDSEASGQSDED